MGESTRRITKKGDNIMSEKKPLADELIKEILKLDIDIEGWKRLNEN